MTEYFFIAFTVIFCIQFIYITFIFGSFPFNTKKPVKNNFNLPVSVIICAKNEAENLAQNLPFFIKQRHEKFELVLINDCSIDNTLSIMEQFKNEPNTNIKIVDVEANEQFWGSKKYALTLGIKAATYEHLLFSDADCKPVSEDWITEMTAHFNENHQIILGYGAYQKIKNSFLNKLIRFETVLTAIQYFSYLNIGIPYMGVGRNLAYTKSIFFSVNGFAKHIKIRSGDDDLFINQVATKKNTSFCITKKSFTKSIAKSSFNSWIQQKRRHVSTASFYKPFHQFLLGTYYATLFLFWIIGIFLLCVQFKWEIIAVLIAVRMLIQYIIFGISAKKLNEKDLILFTPFFELFLIFIQMFIFIKNLFSKPTHW